jgi:hypothetical protein
VMIVAAVASYWAQRAFAAVESLFFRSKPITIFGNEDEPSSAGVESPKMPLR